MIVGFYENVGIFIGFVGFVFTMYEIIAPYNGHKFNDERDPLIHGLDPSLDGLPRTETEEYLHWKNKRQRLVILGIFVTAIGAFLQVFPVSA